MEDGNLGSFWYLHNHNIVLFSHLGKRLRIVRNIPSVNNVNRQTFMEVIHKVMLDAHTQAESNPD